MTGGRPGLLAGRTAMVTGGRQGIGAGIALAFAREGADLIVVDIEPPDPATGIIAQISEAGRSGLFLAADVADAGQVQDMAAALAAFGRIDILVNNAGIFAACPARWPEGASW